VTVNRIKVCVVALTIAAAVSAQSPSAIDEAFTRFFLADDRAAAAIEADKIVAAGVSFDEAWARLKKGRPYVFEKKGEFSLRWKSKAGPYFNNVVDVPADYDPARQWPLRVQLHGGVGRPSPNAVRPGQGSADKPEGLSPREGPPPRAPNRIAGEPQIYAYPSGWADAQWWDVEQVENILRLVDTLKRRYNIDESRIYITGISDGGTGVYYIAMKSPTTWASYLPLNGSIAVLKSSENGADGELYGNNLINAPLYIVNGEQDPLYPVWQVEPHIAWFRQLGVQFVFRPQAGAVHNTTWWPTERAPYEAFVHSHPRPAHPATLTWETERIDAFNRNHWLVIDSLRSTSGNATADKPGRSPDPSLADAGFFRHASRSGRVNITRTGNAFDATTRDVGSFTLLLSPDAVDFSKPVVVTVNGARSFEGMVKKDTAVLLRWAARDNDRTMLYGAELSIKVPER
jgi:predicted esterase